MRPIRKPNGEDPWNSLDPAPLMFKCGGDDRKEFTIGSTQFSVGHQEARWYRTTYGEYRREFGTKWADAWLWRTNCPTDPERLDMLRARVTSYDLATNQMVLFHEDWIGADFHVPDLRSGR